MSYANPRRFIVKPVLVTLANGAEKIQGRLERSVDGKKLEPQDFPSSREARDGGNRWVKAWRRAAS